MGNCVSKKSEEIGSKSEPDPEKKASKSKKRSKKVRGKEKRKSDYNIQGVSGEGAIIGPQVGGDIVRNYHHGTTYNIQARDGAIIGAQVGGDIHQISQPGASGDSNGKRSTGLSDAEAKQICQQYILLEDEFTTHDNTVIRTDAPYIYRQFYKFSKFFEKKFFEEETLEQSDKYASSPMHENLMSSNERVKLQKCLCIEDCRFMAMVGPSAASIELARLASSKYTCCFYIKCMHIKCDKQLTLKELIRSSLKKDLPNDKWERLFEWVIEHDDKCAFIFDGYDYGRVSLEVPIIQPDASYDQALSFPNLLGNVCNGDYLRNSRVIFTLRPYPTAEIEEPVRPCLVIYVSDWVQEFWFASFLGMVIPIDDFRSLLDTHLFTDMECTDDEDEPDVNLATGEEIHVVESSAERHERPMQDFPMVRRLLCGLLLSKPGFKQFPSDVIEEKEKCLVEKICEVARNISRTAVSTIGGDQRVYVDDESTAGLQVSVASHQSSKKLLTLMVDVVGCNRDDVISSFAEHFPQKLFLASHHFTESEAHALRCVLEQLTKPIEIMQLQSCDLTSSHFRQICAGVRKMKEKLVMLDMSFNRLGAESVDDICNILNKVEDWLDLTRCLAGEGGTQRDCTDDERHKILQTLQKISTSKLAVRIDSSKGWISCQNPPAGGRFKKVLKVLTHGK